MDFLVTSDLLKLNELNVCSIIILNIKLPFCIALVMDELGNTRD